MNQLQVTSVASLATFSKHKTAFWTEKSVKRPLFVAVDSLPGEAGVLRSAVLRSGQKVQHAAASARGRRLSEALGFGFPAAPAHAPAPAANRRFHPRPPAKGRRAVLGQPSAQQLQPRRLHVRLPEAPAPQGVHAQPGFGHLAALRHAGTTATAASATEVNARFLAIYYLFKRK